MPQEPQISRQDFARTLKQKFPQLSQYDDEKVVEEFLARQPQWSSRIAPASVGDVAGSGPKGGTTIKARTFGDKAKELIAEGKSVLPAAGAGVATALAPEGAPLWMSLLYAATGGMAGRTAEEGVNRFALGRKPLGVKEAMEESLKAGGEQAGFELGGRAIEGPLSRLFGQGSRSLTAEEKTIKDISEKYGLHLSPAEINRRGVQQSFQRSAESSILGRKTMQSAKDRTFEAAEKAANDALSRLSAPTSALATGQGLQSSLKESNEIFHSMGHRLYEDVDRYGGDVLVDMSPLKAWASRISGGPAGQAAAVFPKMAKLTPAERAILQDTANAPQYVTFSTAHELRKRLLSVGPELTEMMPGVGQGMAKKAAGIVTDLMERASTGLQGKQAVDAWKTARSFWRDGAEIFQDGLIQKLVEQQPSLVVRAVKTPEDVMAVKTALRNYSFRYGTIQQKAGAAEAWNQFRQRYVRDVLLGGEETTRLGQEPLQKLSENLRAIPPETQRALFSDREGVGTYTVLRELGQALERVNKMPLAPELSVWRVLRMGAGIEEYELLLSKALTKPDAARKVLGAIRQIPRSIGAAAAIMKEVQDEEKEGTKQTNQ